MRKDIPTCDAPTRTLSPPRQKRSQSTLDRILRTTERLLEETLFDDLPVQKIVEAAGVSTGSFYARFPSKDSLLAALNQRYYDTLAASSLELYSLVPPEVGLEERVRAMVTERVTRYRRWRGPFRSLLLMGRMRPSTSERSIDERAAATTGQAIIDFMNPVLSEIGHNDPIGAVRRGFYFVSAICRERILFPESPHSAVTPLADDDLIDELSVLLLGYLRAGGANQEGPPA